MSTYTATHTRALALVRRRGAAVTFTKTVQGAYNGLTDERALGTGGTSLSHVVTADGAAVRVDGNPDTYQALGLVELDAPTLFFVPTTAGVLPLKGARGVFDGVTYLVAHRDPIDPDGSGAIAATLIVQAG